MNLLSQLLLPTLFQMDKDVQKFFIDIGGRDIPDEYESKSLGSGVIVDEKKCIHRPLIIMLFFDETITKTCYRN